MQAGDTAVLLDAGPGTFANLCRWGDPAGVSAVVLTHEHPDHWTDLESFATWAGYGPGRARFSDTEGGRLRRARPAGTAASGRTSPRRRGSSGASWRRPWCSRSARCRPDSWPPTTGPPPWPCGLDHEGATLAYSADSGPGWSVEELGPAVGTFLCEATYTRESEGILQHLSGQQAGAMAREAGVARLILTHRWPTVSADAVRREAEAAFGRPVEQATPGCRLQLVGVAVRRRRKECHVRQTTGCSDAEGDARTARGDGQGPGRAPPGELRA